MIDVNRFCPGCMGEATGDRYCDICGYDNLSKNPVEALNVRFLLNNRYVIGKVLEQSSEGFTYLAFDTESNTPVDIKEYFPLGISIRHPDKTVASKSSVDNFYYNEGLLEFVDLNRKLSKIENIVIFPILSVFEDNGTAYSVMAHNTGITLSSFLERNGNILKWEQARPLFFPLIETIVTLNDNGIIHGGISPETISVGRDGKLRLTNIAIIKTRFASENFATAIYPGCAAIEQYSAEKGNMGSFTDVYGISSTLFRVLLGTLPPPANERINNDKMSISSSIASDLPRQVLVALANGLQVKIGDRTVSTVKFRDELVYGDTQDNLNKEEAKKTGEVMSSSSSGNISSRANTKDSADKNKSSSLKYAGIAAACTAGLFLIIITAAVFLFPNLRDAIFNKKDDKNVITSQTPSTETESQVEDKPISPNEKLYKVPAMVGKPYIEILKAQDTAGENNYEYFNISVSGKAFSNTIPRGYICTQSVEADKEVPRGTEVKLVISLGPEKIKIANVIGATEDAAKIELLKQGFLYDNIEVIEKYDSNSKPATIIQQEPEFGTVISPDASVTVYLNSYKGEEEKKSTSSSSNKSSKSSASKKPNTTEVTENTGENGQSENADDYEEEND